VLITAAQLSACFTGVDPALLAAQIDALNAVADDAQLFTPDRWAMFLGQVGVESCQFTHFEENLNYGAAALVTTWPHHFDAALAAQYARQPQRIANRAYAGRMGNGDEQSGDGWRYRGRGAIQLTGFNNYLAASQFLGIDLRGNPDLAAADARFAVSAWYWRTHGLNAFADAHDCAGATKAVNGGLLGLSQRQAIADRSLVALHS
jgi:putative chitinase